MTYLHDWIKDPDGGPNEWHCARCFAEVAAIRPPAEGCVATVEEGVRAAIQREQARYAQWLIEFESRGSYGALPGQHGRERGEMQAERDLALSRIFGSLIESIRADKASPELLRELTGQPFSDRLLQAVRVGMLDIDPIQKTATILAPPDARTMSDDDWLAVIAAAGELRHELEPLGYKVEG